MNNKDIKLKNDKFKKSRGGYSRWLLISCEKCKNSMFTYQKDGSGILKRLYFDRIVGLDSKNFGNLICRKCRIVIGTPIIYKKEHRKAYRLFVGAIEKKIINENKIKKFLHIK
ncbi:MAG: hypothetical protein A3F94_00515 [Candidatus Spechtbacteria bacterium RIFCSPLOWO2_12_FULL_38_22]|uniref:Uncharacterized protein n=1 Tax=Candidatus Spechtbacteria bacterium RIFCSPLOWO2_12_FULL_38_22 TaxID=1802165 RepID=A0A1G2HG42_9BACT|nr:MAG: hypothetical protein A2728_00680 [Candidatus Spechtbacteria bacterium RIFCSPHIGHO2_01_FULL_38_11]OGZ59510.1 MAG: hypothetical protein A3E58_02440 [Candidatus Spechtbacteria bacterium RIFCSPHIGHO2_12_FULL_38_30]OGZ59807.1 MAG: hypothetical protein A3A00_00125 [Candidatus Spechtbacteria bacterium RIFCSPLOWO2_01_FULL_38_20]OGZ61423.1 MAG: hypothetical protein A3F94_00515 [Candidatus Spechtbacteria bacterium RIFCSPLOWO2_12_FULL_38_22]